MEGLAWLGVPKFHIRVPELSPGSAADVYHKREQVMSQACKTLSFMEDAPRLNSCLPGLARPNTKQFVGIYLGSELADGSSLSLGLSLPFK